MKRNRLISFLEVGFLVVFRGSIFLLLLELLISSPLWQEAYWRWELRDRQLPTDGSHILYDTVASSRNVEMPVTLRGKSKEFPFTITKSEVGIETRYTLTDSLWRQVWTRTKAELRQGPDSLLRMVESAEQFSARRQKAEIDSTLRHNPDAYIIKRRSSYSILEPSFSSGFSLPMSSGMGPSPNRYEPNKVWDYNNNDRMRRWEYIMNTSPMIKVKREPEFVGRDYYLIFLYRTWRQFKAIPAGAMVLGELPFLLAWCALLIGLYQFNRLFRDLNQGRYFDRDQPNRINRIGWTLIIYFVLDIVLVNVQNIYVQNYFNRQGFRTYRGFIPRFSDHWSLLITGLVLLVLASVFAYGRQLREEHDLTI